MDHRNVLVERPSRLPVPEPALELRCLGDAGVGCGGEHLSLLCRRLVGRSGHLLNGWRVDVAEHVGLIGIPSGECSGDVGVQKLSDARG